MKAIQLTLLSFSLVGSMLAPAAQAADDPMQNVASASDDAVIVAEAPDAAASQHHHGGWHHGGGMMGLSDDQLSQLADIHEATREKTAAQRSQMHALKYQLHKALMQPTVDKAQALSIQSKISALRGEIASARLSGMIDAMSIFTPEQRQHMRHMMLMHSVMRGMPGMPGMPGHTVVLARMHGPMGGMCGMPGDDGACCGDGHHGFGGHMGEMHQRMEMHGAPGHPPEGEDGDIH